MQLRSVSTIYRLKERLYFSDDEVWHINKDI